MSIPTHEPIKINLQLFAGDGKVEDDDPMEPDEAEEDTEIDADTQPETEDSEAEKEDKPDEPEQKDTNSEPPKQDKPKIKVVYDQKPYELTYEEWVKYAQKGMNYDRVHGKLTTYEQQAKRIKDVTGYEMDKAIEFLETVKLKQDAESLADKEGISVSEATARLEKQKADKEVKRIRFVSTIEEQKKPLREKVYFTELEPEIDKIVNDSIDNGDPINVETAYNYLRGQKLEELMEKHTTTAKKSAIADMQDKLKRGVAAPSESGQAQTMTVKVNTHMANVFGNDPKEIAKYKRDNLKRR
jgi:hypothetical protein